jgi:DNA repair exonuclease SbcCD ATPase subunit
MDLEIVNIKTWENIKLHIDVYEFKHILITGISGIGKTTILDCIYFALTGGYLTNKWSLRHKRKPGRVIMYLKSLGMTVTRTLNPKSLQVTMDNGVISNGDEAQEYITTHLDGGVFKYIGYLRQKSTYSYFISMTPKDRMNFFENVIFKEIDVDTTKTAIKEAIDVAKAEYIVLDMQMAKLDARNIEPRVTEKEIESMKKYIDFLISSKKTLDESVNNVNILESKAQDLQIIQYELSKEAVELKHRQGIIDTFVKQFTSSKLSMYQKKVKEYEDTEVFYKKFQDIYKRHRVNKYDLEKKMEINLDELNEEIMSQQHMMSVYNDYLRIEKQIKDLRFNPTMYTELLDKYNNACLIYNNCPNCNVLLGANMNGIFTVTGNERPYTNDQLVQLKNSLTETESRKQKHIILKGILTDLENKLHFPIWTDDELEVKMALKREQEEYHIEYDKLTKLKMLTPDYPRISKNEYNVMKDDLTLYTNYTTERTFVQEQLNTIMSKLDKVNDKIATITKDLELSAIQFEQFSMLVSSLEKKQEKLDNLQATYEYQCVYYDYMEKKQVYDDYVKFQKIFNETRTQVIMYTLESINTIIKKYSDGFFENYHLQFSFYVNDKDCIDIHIQYENANPADLSILSGGEYDRIVLGVVLAFGEFYKLPVLLLDEITSSLDLHTLQYIMTHITKCYPDNQAVIYVGHQMISENFDHLIDLEQIN